MKEIKLKPDFATREFGYNNKFLPLGQRDDLHLFLIEAYRANRQDQVAFFDDPPSLEDLLKAEAEKKLAGNKVYTTQALHLAGGQVPMSTAPATPQGAPGLAGQAARITADQPAQSGTEGTQEANTATGAPATAVPVVTGLAGRTQQGGGTGTQGAGGTGTGSGTGTGAGDGKAE